MIIDFDKIVTRNIEGSRLNQVYEFYLSRGNKILAKIKLLGFKEGFGSEAKILSEHSGVGSVSSGRIFVEAEEAINDVISLIAHAVAADPEIGEGRYALND